MFDALVRSGPSLTFDSDIIGTYGLFSHSRERVEGVSEAVMRCSGVTRYHGAVAAVEDVDFELVPGEILSILGPSPSRR